ncbi:MAG: carboxypeptidase-like regulatory domain-containing protein [Gemmatimonadaceae bacterium]|nr:carboxypeptidase-like regulatory domain-containing protein [Gemmatimonadaceae bacterium]
MALAVAAVALLSLVGRTTELASAPVDERPSIGAAPDTVRGIVFDSLGGAPLTEAFIFAEPAGVSVPTDSLGRFLVVSDKRVERLTVYHDALDDIGLGAIVLARPTDAARWTDVTIATPSLTTIWRTVCQADVPEDENRGVLVGSVRLADDRTRVSGAGITAQWEAILPRTRLRQAEQRSTRSDSTGAYALCGVPAVGELVMAGASVEYESGAVQVALADRPLRRIDLVLAPANSRVDRWPTITGRVVGPDQQPVANARVAVDGVDSVVIADADGRFSMVRVPLGSRMIGAQADGFAAVAQQVNVLEANTPEVIITLERALSIAGLEGIAVTERRTIRRERMMREAGSLRAALEQVPGLVVQNIPGSDDATRFALYGRGRNLSIGTCSVQLLVDGLPATLDELHAISVTQFAAVEVYRNVSFAPERFGQFAENDCALVAFWTQYGLRP